MALFGTPTSYVGIDMGTSSLKLVELVQRKKRVEVATYAEAQIANPLVEGEFNDSKTAVDAVANILSKMLDEAEVSSDMAVAALPNPVVFSTVITLPQIPDKEMEKAVQFAARDIVPADLNEMVLGWSRVGHKPHMSTDTDAEVGHTAEEEGVIKKGDAIPVFITAAPKRIVTQYVEVMKKVGLHLQSLEVETFPLVRSLLHDADTPTIIVDIGDRATTYHIVDQGTPRVTHTIDFGGYDITEALVVATEVTREEADRIKSSWGITSQAQEDHKVAIELAVRKQIEEFSRIQRLYTQRKQRKIMQTVLIGGGANLPGLRDFWQATTNITTIIGNPWKGLSYPQELEQRLLTIGPTYGVAVGLAMRGFSNS